MNDKCECGHAKDDHANHYDYHQCFILGCGCQEYTAAQQSVQADDCPSCAGSGKKEIGGMLLTCLACDGTGNRR